jgi:phage gpG-like protein
MAAANASLIGGLALVLDANVAQVQFAIRAGRFENYAPVLNGSVLTTLRRMEEIHFDSEGGVFGGKWPPLAPGTLLAKERKGYGSNPILTRTGKLRNSLTKRGKKNGSIVKTTPFSILFGTSVPYAVYHQQPDGPAKGIIPLRQLIPDPLPDAVLEELRENVRDYLVEGRVRGRETG